MSAQPRRSWYIVGVLTVAYTCSFIDRSVLGLMVGPIRDELGITDTQFSLLQGLAFAIFYTLLGIPIARLADRTNRRNIVAAGIALWSLMTALCGLARSFGSLFMARVGVGVGEAALAPAAFSLITDLFPRKKVGRAIGTYQTGLFVGYGLSVILGGWLVGTLEQGPPLELPLLGELSAWRATLVIVGLPGLVIALLCLTFREPARHGGAQAGPDCGDIRLRGIHSRRHACRLPSSAGRSRRHHPLRHSGHARAGADFVFANDLKLHYSMAIIGAPSGLLGLFFLWRLLPIYRRAMAARNLP